MHEGHTKEKEVIFRRLYRTVLHPWGPWDEHPSFRRDFDSSIDTIDRDLFTSIEVSLVLSDWMSSRVVPVLSPRDSKENRTSD